MRVVLDTNVIVSALLFGGQLHFIADLLARGAVTPCFSQKTWSELDRVLHYPHLRSELHAQDLEPESILSRLEMQARFFQNAESPITIAEDPSDEAILGAAIVSSARAIITGDRHLLAHAGDSPIPILTPRQFKGKFSHRIE